MRKWILSVLLISAMNIARAQAPTITTDLHNIYGCGTNGYTYFIIGTNNANGWDWQVSTDGASTWTDIASNSSYTVSASALYIYSTSAMNGYQYRCIVSNSSGSVTSAVATLFTVNGVPGQAAILNPLTWVCQGSSFALHVTGLNPGDSIHWFCANCALTPSGYQFDEGDTTPTVNFAGAGTAYITSQWISNNCGVSPYYFADTVVVVPSGTSLAGTAGGGQDCASFTVYPGAPTSYSDGTCSQITAVTPSGASPVSGTIQSCVTVDASVPTYNGVPYVPRYYSIEPSANASTSTATITLYFTQADFDAYNAARGSNPALPTGPGDAAGIANLTVSQFHGSGTTPDTYVGTSGTITPSSVVWNSTASRWEVTFDVTGFSGFFVSGGSLIPLPLTLTSFAGKAGVTGNVLNWTTGDEENTAWFEIERSAAGESDFQPVGKVAAAGNSTQTLAYSYTDGSTDFSRRAWSYRLRMVDLDGKFTYSRLVTLQPAVAALNVRVSPNPFVQPVSIVIGSPSAVAAVLTVLDIDGRKLTETNIVLQRGDNPVDPGLVGRLPQGIYFLRVATAGEQQTIRIVKE